MTDSPMLRAALAYAETGWAVFPVHSVKQGRCSCGKPRCSDAGKHPRTKHGVLEASTNPEQLTEWWGRWPNANVGIATGTVSGLVIVDVDPRNGGDQTIASLHLPPTRTVLTGGGGKHFYFELGAALPGGKLGTGVDLKADGGYVVAPPSSHVSGGTYEWAEWGVPLTRWAGSPTGTNGHSTPATGHGPTIEPDQKSWVTELLGTRCPEGQRNQTLTRLSGYFRNVLPEAVTLSLLRQWNQACCQPPMDDAELTNNVRHKYQRYAGESEHVAQVWTARTLLEATMPDVLYVVEGMLPEGLAVLGGRPKRGKSWLALQIAIDIVTGRGSLGKSVHPGKVIYLALEDSPRRLKTRLERMGSLPTNDLMFWTDFTPLDSGGLADLADLIEVHRPVLVIIDTMARILGRKADQDSNSDMTGLLAPLQRLAMAAHLCVLLIDHHRKPGLEVVDAIDDVMGSTAKVGVADCIWGLYRKLGESSGTLKITGRDLEEQELAVVWDAMRYRWRVEGDAPARELEDRIAQIKDLVDQVGEVDLKAVTNLLHLSDDVCDSILTEMRNRHLVERTPLQTGQRGRPRFLYTRDRRHSDDDD